MILSFLLLMMLTISETIGFYGEQVSTVVTPTRTMLVVEIFLLVGITRQLTLTRLQWKKATHTPGSSTTAKVPFEKDAQRKTDIFSSTSHHQDKALEGLFGNMKHLILLVVSTLVLL